MKPVEDTIEVMMVDTPRKRVPAAARKRVLVDSNDDLASPNKIRKEDETSLQNLCVVCGDDMGDSNPRQLCGKTKCLKSDDIEASYSYYSDCLELDEELFVPPSVEEFMVAVEKAKPLKWKSLDQNLVYVVERVEETDSFIEGQTRKSYIGTIRSGGKDSRVKVWLPNLASKTFLELLALPNKIVCMRPRGEKTAKTGRVYENFDTFVYDKPQPSNC